MNAKVLDFLVRELAAKALDKADPDAGPLLNLVKSSNGDVEKAVTGHSTVVEARLKKSKAQLLANIAEIDELLAEIEADNG